MNRVILQPCGEKDAFEHFEATIQTEVSLDRIRKHISDDNVWAELTSLYPGGSCAIWGVEPKSGKNIKTWGDIKPASEYKGMPSTWEYIYFLSNVTRREIPMEAINPSAGYSPDKVVQGFVC